MAGQKEENKMRNITMTQGLSPLGIRIVGTGEYVKNKLEHLVDYFDLMKHDAEEEIRQSYEH